MKYNKISDTEFEIVETIVRKTPVSLEKLRADKESLLRTIENNNRECARQNEVILQMISEIDKYLIDAKGLGIKEKVIEQPTEVVEEVITE